MSCDRFQPVRATAARRYDPRRQQRKRRKSPALSLQLDVSGRDGHQNGGPVQGAVEGWLGENQISQRLFVDDGLDLGGRNELTSGSAGDVRRKERPETIAQPSDVRR